MVQVVRELKEIEVDASDVITLKRASEISGRSKQNINTLVQLGKLPWLQKAEDERLEGEVDIRYTLKSEVLKLPPKEEYNLKGKKGGAAE